MFNKLKNMFYNLFFDHFEEFNVKMKSNVNLVLRMFDI